MTEHASSTIAVLCYTEKADLDFGALVADLAEAFYDEPGDPARAAVADDGFFVTDLPGLRICLAGAELGSDRPDLALAADCAQVVIVSVGSAPDPAGAPPPPERFDLRDRIADYVELLAPCDHRILLSLPAVVDAGRHDDIVAQLWLASLRREAERLAGDSAAALAAEARTIVPRRPIERRVTRFAPVPQDDALALLDSRAEAEQAARDAAWHAHTERFNARHAPGQPRPSGAASPWFTPRSWATLRPQAPSPPAVSLAPSQAFDASPQSEPLVHRAAVNGLNVAMVAFALPVGAALLTLAVLGRESLGVSSRATALTGAYMGITHADSVTGLLSYFP